MNKAVKLTSILMVCAVVFFSAPCRSIAGIWGESVGLGDLQDSRDMSVLEGLYPGFSISWNIWETFPGSGLWNYEYFITGDKDISNFILEFTDPLDETIMDFRVNGNPATFEGAQEWSKSGNVNLPNYFYGIKTSTDDLDPVSYSFQVALDPVWGNFHAKSGKMNGNNVIAYNAALALQGFESDNPDYFIVRPNGGSNPPVIPEPISSALFLIGGSLLAGRRYLSRKK